MWIQISSGRGPVECSRGVFLFFRKVLQPFFSTHSIEYTIVSSDSDDTKNTFKSVMVSVDLSDPELGNFLKDFEGTMLWICKSPFRRNHKRKNWFFNVMIFDEPEFNCFSENDLVFRTCRSSGPGGQNVNKVETAVEILHVPTGLTVKAREERSQLQNKKLAMARLQKMINSKNLIKMEDKKSEIWTQHNGLERGNPVRTYHGEGFLLKNR